MGFLLLTRRAGESIEISNGTDTIVVAVSSVDRGQVRLAFNAPQHYNIVRTEIKGQERKNG